MKNFVFILCLTFTLTLCKSDSYHSSLPPMPFSEKSLKEEGRFVCAILVNLTTRTKVYFHKEECLHKTPPASLYHSILTLIALENGYLKEDQSLFYWDKTRHPYIRWQKDQNLKSALEYSVHWYFTKLWKDIGPEKGKQFLERLNDFSSPVPFSKSSFWLDGSFVVSPSEFADFLIRLQDPSPPFHKKTIQIVSRLLKRSPGTLSNASGSHDLPGDWSGSENYSSDSAFYYNQDEANSWFWTSFQKAEVSWLLLTRIRMKGHPALPLDAAKLGAQILQDEFVLPHSQF